MYILLSIIDEGLPFDAEIYTLLQKEMHKIGIPSSNIIIVVGVPVNYSSCHQSGTELSRDQLLNQ